MAGYLLIISVLLLGGVIATVGDRLGYKVGKARLSLFNLRPRDTAVVITILTGGVISASTLGILFTVSDSLRTGVFELEKIQDKLNEARSELEDALGEKETVEQERDQAQQDRLAAQQRLDQINEFLEAAQEEQEVTARELTEVVERADRLRSEVDRLSQDREELIAQRRVVQEQIAQRDEELQRQETIIAEGQQELQDLQDQQAFLDAEILELEQDLLLLRERRVVLARGEILAAQLIQVNATANAEAIVDGLLRQANQIAQRKTLPGTHNSDQTVIQIPQAEVDRLTAILQDQQPYVVRILSAGNYVTGETPVLVFMDVSLNRIVFPAGEVIASTAADPETLTERELRERINLLLSASQFRARQSGIVNDNIEVPIDSLVGFLREVLSYGRPLVIQAVALEPAYTVGPLRLAFVARNNDDAILFRSDAPPLPGI